MEVRLPSEHSTPSRYTTRTSITKTASTSHYLLTPAASRRLLLSQSNTLGISVHSAWAPLVLSYAICPLLLLTHSISLFFFSPYLDIENKSPLSSGWTLLPAIVGLCISLVLCALSWILMFRYIHACHIHQSTRLTPNHPTLLSDCLAPLIMTIGGFGMLVIWLVCEWGLAECLNNTSLSEQAYCKGFRAVFLCTLSFLLVIFLLTAFIVKSFISPVVIASSVSCLSLFFAYTTLGNNGRSVLSRHVKIEDCPLLLVDEAQWRLYVAIPCLSILFLLIHSIHLFFKFAVVLTNTEKILRSVQLFCIVGILMPLLTLLVDDIQPNTDTRDDSILSLHITPFTSISLLLILVASIEIIFVLIYHKWPTNQVLKRFEARWVKLHSPPHLSSLPGSPLLPAERGDGLFNVSVEESEEETS